MWLSASQIGMRYLHVPTWFCSLSGICWLKAVDTHVHEGTDLPLCCTQRWSCPGVLSFSPQGLPSLFWLSSLIFRSKDLWAFFLKTFFLMWTIFEVFIEFVAILLLFHVLFFLAMRHVGSQLPDWGLNPHPLHWEVKYPPWATRKVPCELLVSFQ